MNSAVPYFITVGDKHLYRPIKRKELAKLIDKTPATVSALAKKGVFKRVKDPLSRRTYGYTFESVERFLNGEAAR